MSKHTPGPWFVHPQQAEGCFPTRHYIGAKPDGAGPYWLASTDGNETNAALIAAAPELLAALRKVVAGVDEHEGWQMASTIAEARAAIAKAEGEAA
jgi:hypothetical protein